MITDKDLQISMIYDERKRTMTFVTVNQNQDLNVQSSHTDVYPEQALIKLWNGLKNDKGILQDNINNTDDKIRQLADRMILMDKDVKQQKLNVTSELTPELQELRDNLEILQNWNQIYGKPKHEIVALRDVLDQKKLELKTLNKRMTQIQAQARNLNLK